MKTARLLRLLTAAALTAALLIVGSIRSARAEDDAWQTDFKAALAKAKAEKKYVLIDFTGSDWCVWCKKLHKEVFVKEPFKTEAPKHYVLVELDFPNQKEQSDDLKKQNEDLKQKYKPEGFPTVFILDPEGQVIAHTGYEPGGPEKYLKHLAEFNSVYENVVALKGKLPAAAGVDRAKLLDQIIEGYAKLNNEPNELDKWTKDILALDADNKAGLKFKYVNAEAKELVERNKLDEAKDTIDGALALQNVSPEARQEGYMTKAEICDRQHKPAELLAALKSAKAAAPNSPEAKHIDDQIHHATEAIEAEATVAKLEPDLPKAEGLERAKLLDKLIEAKQKLPMNQQTAESIQKWTKEIVTLDADNKAGLKKKYEFKAALMDAAQLAQSGKIEEANAAVDKALQTPDIAPEDVQKGWFMKAQFTLSHRDLKQGMTFLKKALDAAPNSEMAPNLKQFIAQVEEAAKSEHGGDE